MRCNVSMPVFAKTLSSPLASEEDIILAREACASWPAAIDLSPCAFICLIESIDARNKHRLTWS